MAKEVSIFTLKVLLEAGELFGASEKEMLAVLPDPSMADKKWGAIDWDHAVDLMRVAFRPAGTGPDLVPAGQDYLNKRYKTRSAHLYGQYTSWEKALWVAKHLMAGRIVKGHAIEYEKTEEPDRFMVTMTLPEQLTPYPDFFWFCTGVWTGSSDMAALKHTIHSIDVDSHHAVADITFDKRSRASRTVHNPIYSRWKTRRDLKRTLQEVKQQRAEQEREAANLQTVLHALRDPVFLEEGDRWVPQNLPASRMHHLLPESWRPGRCAPGELIETPTQTCRVRTRSPLAGGSLHLITLTDCTRELQLRKEMDLIPIRERQVASQNLEAGLGVRLRELESGIHRQREASTVQDRRDHLGELADLTRLCRKQAKALATGEDREVVCCATLEQALQQMADDYRDIFGYELKVELQSSPRVEDAASWRDLYLLLREAVRNAYRHSGGDRAVIEISEEAILICDNGQGLSNAPASSPKFNSGLGCHNIRERAVRIGARPHLLAEPGNGWKLLFSETTDKEALQ